MTKTKSFTGSREVAELLNSVLSALRSVTSPVTGEELSKATDIEPSLVLKSIEYLEDKGYDIKRIVQGKTVRYVLVRFGQNEMGAYYRSQGDIETPCILSADWHLGSFGFSQIALENMIKNVKEHGVKHIVVAGDFYQGRGVHRLELEDCKSLSVDEQEAWGLEAVDQFPSNVQFHTICGNHEEKIKASIHVGHDMLLATAKQRANFAYYGHIAKFNLNKKFTMMVIHTSGGLTYAKTYRPERVFDQLLERPNFLVTGHMHQLFAVGRPPNVIVSQAGTLQRENSYLLNKGVTAQVGYMILHEFTDENANIQYCRPRVY